jgi:hypothetical protein
MSYTPGPWKCSGGGAITGPDGEYIASVQTLLDMRANARLIAAAPDLLEALKVIAAIEDRFNGGDWDEIEDARKIARAAIAKAEVE